jgi:predicted phosphodiesterase
LRVGVIGDSGFGDPATFALAVAMAAYKVDFVIQMGDAVYRVDENDSPAEAFSEKWYLPFSALLHEMPVYPVVGNHDVEPATRNDQGLPFYYEAFPSFDETASGSQRRWASFGRNGVQFLLLDTQAFYGEADNEAQSSWLAERLSDTQYKYSIPAFHIPPFSSDIVHSQDGLPVRAWTSLFEQANVPLVLSGHAHNYERLEQNGVTYIVSGGGSQALYASGVIAPQSKVFISQTHFTLLEIYEEHLDITAISRDGDILDQKTISTP